MDIYTTLLEMLLKKTKKEGIRTGLKMAMELYEESGYFSYDDLSDKELLKETIDGYLAAMETINGYLAADDSDNMNYISSHTRKKKYIFINLTNCSEMDSCAISQSLGIDFYDSYHFPVNTQHGDELRLYDYVPNDFVTLRTPMVYLVDSISSLQNNETWYNMRKSKQDLVIDRNGNRCLLYVLVKAPQEIDKTRTWKKYRLKISYSWGDEELTEKTFDNFEDAWTIAQNMALKEMETASSEYGDDDKNCEIGLTIDKKRKHIDLHYTHDNSHCYYDIIESLADVPDSMKIPLEGGTLIAERSLDSDYPGIDIEFIPDGNTETPSTYPRVVVEKPKDGKLRCLVWGNKDSEDYSNKIEFDI